MTIEIVDFKLYQKNTLQGFATVRMENIGLEIRDIALHQKNDKEWLTMPARPYEDSEGNQKYAYILDWYDKNLKGQFENTVLALLKKQRYLQG